MSSFCLDGPGGLDVLGACDETPFVRVAALNHPRLDALALAVSFASIHLPLGHLAPRHHVASVALAARQPA